MNDTESSFDSILQIDGEETPVPCDFNPNYSDYDSESSGRSETFVLMRDVVRTNLRAVSFKWRLKSPEMRRLLEMISPKEVTVRFYDPYQPASAPYSEFTAYAEATRDIKLLDWQPENPEESWWELEISFVEY